MLCRVVLYYVVRPSMKRVVHFTLMVRCCVSRKVFGEDASDESGDALLESVLGQGGSDGLTGTTCGPTFVTDAIIDREVVSAVCVVMMARAPTVALTIIIVL